MIEFQVRNFSRDKGHAMATEDQRTDAEAMFYLAKGFISQSFEGGRASEKTPAGRNDDGVGHRFETGGGKINFESADNIPLHCLSSVESHW